MAKQTSEAPLTWPDWLVGLLMIEAMSIATGLLMPITSNARGGEWHLTSVFGMQPSYLANALLWYFVSSGVLLLIGGVVWFRKKGDSKHE